MFKKTGDLQYISHLDLVRTMHKIIVRANLPLWYTEGFNPKPKLIFAAPLSIGTQSEVEFVDIRVTEPISPEAVKESLNRNLTENMQVKEVYYPESKLTDLRWLSYDFSVKTEGADAALAEKCRSVLLGERVMIEKKNKKGELVEVDVRPLIKSASVGFVDGLIKIYAVLSADASNFLNPEHIIKVLKREVGILSSGNLLAEHYSIMRKSAYKENMSEFR